MLGGSVTISGSVMPSSLHIGLIAVAVRAITLTSFGIRLLTLPKGANFF